MIETRSVSEDSTGTPLWLVSRTVYDSQGGGELTTDRYMVYDDIGNQTLSFRHTEDEDGADWTIVNRTYYDVQGRSTGSAQYVVSGHTNYTDAVDLDPLTPVQATANEYANTGQAETTTDQFDRLTRHTYGVFPASA